MCLLERRMEALEAKGKGHCGVQKLPNFDLFFDLFFPLSLPQGYPAAPAPQRSRNPGLTLVCPHEGGPEGET